MNDILNTIGPCPDPEQRIHDLYAVNTTASWARGQLATLLEMSQYNKLPQWYVEEVRRILNGIETVGKLARSREAKGARS